MPFSKFRISLDTPDFDEVGGLTYDQAPDYDEAADLDYDEGIQGELADELFDPLRQGSL